MIDLNPHHLGTVKRILAEHVPDCEVRAFGSRATWTAWEYSDLDLAVVSPEPLAWTPTAACAKRSKSPTCRSASMSWIGAR